MAAKQKLGPKKESLWLRVRRSRIAYLFIAPAVAVMLLIHLIPTAQAIYLSLLNVTVEYLAKPFSAPFVGLDHYRRIIHGLIFGGDALIKGLGQALVNSVYFLVSVQLGTTVLGLVLALLLNRDFRGRGLARTLVLLPAVVPTFVVGLIFQFIWLQRGGLANRVLVDWLHIADQPISWLVGENSRIALIIPAIWRGLPLAAVQYLAALQAVPEEIYEAANMDGANTWQKFRHIALPFLTPILFVTNLFGIIFNFFGFGPYNIAVSLFSSDNLGNYNNLLAIAIVRQTFNNQLYGYGAAASALMMIVALVVLGIWYRLFRSGLVSD
ncbi:MAG: sugar ABC transporter permease [Anaerolineae bacterium]|nr:sugar ABC transporter permease [Anaerolineae bacterium]